VFYTSSEDKAELVPFLGQAREFLTDSTLGLFILMMMYIYFMFFIGTSYGDGKGVDKDCGDHTIYNL
jgi:hypothetical protein